MARFKDLDATFEAPDGELYISLASHPNLVWDMPRFSTSAGTTPILYTRNNGANQRWRFEIHHAGTVYTFFNIINVHSGLALALQPDNTISQQVRVNPSSETQQQSWVMGYPGSRGNTSEPARPAEPHPTGSTGTRLRVHGARGGGGPVDATHAVSGTPITLNLWENFETGWTFTAAT